MASISSIGVGSGLPLSDLLAKLRSAEEAPLNHLKNRYATFETRLSAYGTLKAAVATLQDAAKGLAKAETFGALKVGSSNADTIAATITHHSAAVEGSYSIEVLQLATRHGLATAGVNTRTDAIGNGGTLHITIDGATHNIELDGNPSLDSIRNAINKANLGLTASIINNGAEADAHQLVLTSNVTGANARILGIGVVGNESLHQVLAYGTGLRGDEDFTSTVAQTVPALNAVVNVNGIPIQSQTNTIDDAIEGVKLELSAVTVQNTPVTVSVSKNNAPAISAIQTFVSAYNALHTTIKSLTSYDAEAQRGSALTGDSVARSVQTQARQLLSFRHADNTATLGQLGITTDPSTGKLSLDTNEFSVVLGDTPQVIDEFFRNEDGFAARVNKMTEAILRTGGLIDTATAGAEETMKDLSNQFDRVERRIDDTMARYQAQFVALDALVAQMNSTSTYLAQQLDMLTAQAKASMK